MDWRGDPWLVLYGQVRGKLGGEVITAICVGMRLKCPDNQFIDRVPGAGGQVQRIQNLQEQLVQLSDTADAVAQSGGP